MKVNDKEILRHIMIRLRRGMNSTEHTQLSNIIYENVISFLDKYYGKRKRLTIGLYYPIHSEVDTMDIIKYIISFGWSVYLPTIKGTEMKYKKFESFDNLKEGPFGINEPSRGRIAKSLDVLFVPGLAFDKKGYRIGYGKGYFDKYLSNIKKVRASNKRKNKTIVLGLAFDFQINTQVPRQEHDVKVDYIITETRIIKTGGSIKNNILKSKQPGKL